jgi:twitching motility two-component system response regulator PilH
MRDVLIVDDDPAMTAIAGRHLEQQGYAVTRATSGAEALERLERRPFAVVVTDLVMQAFDGLTVLRARSPPYARGHMTS